MGCWVRKHRPDRHEHRGTVLAEVVRAATPQLSEDAWSLFGQRAAEGVELKEEALDKHDAAYYDLLAACRKELERIHRGSGRPVHADDARHYLEQRPELNESGRKDWMGALFRDGKWEAVGWHQSSHPENHARMMRTWRLKP